MLKRTLLAFLGLGLALALGVTLTYYIPVSWALGPCMRDWTSPSSYIRRQSPMAKVRFPLGPGDVQICYGRPQARGRKVFGGLVSFGSYWRTGANEPTRLFTSIPLRIAGVELPPGRYSLYTFPGDTLWEIVFNTSTFHWGIPYTEALQRTELARASVRPQPMPVFVDTFTIRPGRIVDDSLHLYLEWEATQVPIPLKAVP